MNRARFLGRCSSRAPCPSFLLVVALLPACSFAGRIPRDAVDYNLAVEHAQNRLVLMNIVRAAHRQPMHFTALTIVRGNLRAAAEAGNSFPLGGDAPSQITLSSQGAYSSNPTFDVSVLDSEKFMRGILSPVPISTVKYYVDQGWPVEILMHLLVRKVEIDGKEIVNAPFDREGYAHFRAAIAALTAGGRKVSLVSKTVWKPVGPLLASDKASDLSGNLAAAKEGWEVRSTPEGFRLHKPETTYELVSKGPDVADITTALQFVAQEAPAPPDAGPLPRGKWLVFLRSPEAILYYLGELLRAQADPTFVTPTTGPLTFLGENGLEVIQDAPLFLARESRVGDRSDLLDVTYRGRRYVIPPTRESGRSMHCLSLALQLIALQKSADELRPTPAVSLVGN